MLPHHMTFLAAIDWHEMFVIDLPLVGEKIIRSAIVYAFLLLILRVAGKRELAALNPFDLIVLMTLSNALQNAIIGNDNSVTGGLVGAGALILVNRYVVQYVHRHRRLEKAIAGCRDFLVRDGKVLKDHLNKELMTRAELAAACHKQGIASLAEVETAVLEPTGTITFVTRKPTPDDERHHEVMLAIEHLRAELTALQANKLGDA